jgi:23S rRNA pseudouridine955/2504/2580 synthase
MSGVKLLTVSEDEGEQRLDKWFKRRFPQLTQGHVEKMCRTGQIRVDGARAKAADRIVPGQSIRVPPLPETEAPSRSAEGRVNAADAKMIQNAVLWKDEHIIILNKPAGLPSQGGSGQGDRHVDGLAEALKFGYKEKPKLVHRLDKDTSGVLLLARTARAAAFFSKEFSGREAKKTYWALTLGVPEIRAGTIDAAISKQPGSGGEKMHVDPETGLKAKTRYRVIDKAAARAAWVEFQPLTGRTHQIRVHAAAISHPLIGDGKYGGKESYLTGGISRKLHLHSRRLVIALPDGGTLDIKAELPSHMAESFAMLGFDLALGDYEEPPPPPPPKKLPRRLSSATSGNRRGERRSRGQVAEAPPPRRK